MKLFSLKTYIKSDHQQRGNLQHQIGPLYSCNKISMKLFAIAKTISSNKLNVSSEEEYEGSLHQRSRNNHSIWSNTFFSSRD